MKPDLDKTNNVDHGQPIINYPPPRHSLRNYRLVVANCK